MNTKQIQTGIQNFTVALPDGTAVPRLGQGGWYLGDDPGLQEREISALQQGIALGLKLVDTAEMYGSGRSETLIGKAIKSVDRASLFLVSKVYPHNAGRPDIFESCAQSLKRLGTEYLDLYLLHWRGGVPLAQTVDCMQELIAQGKIRRWGVSNFDLDDMQELWNVPGGDTCAVNQVLYHLGSRGIEYDLLPWMQRQGVPAMAYCPLAQAGTLRRELLESAHVNAVAKRHGVSPMQVLLAFVLRQPQMIAIPKAGTPEHVVENAVAAQIQLTEQDLQALSEEFPAPTRKMPLDIV